MEHDMRSGLDPITEDPAELDVRADEEAREYRWDVFVAVIKVRKAVLHHWSDVIEDANHALFLEEEGRSADWCDTDFEKACYWFAESEGWDAVFSAIARAMRNETT